MSSPDSPSARAQTKIRRDGWTAERQLRFLDALARTRSVTRAAAFADMSRESAYRLRSRRDGALFAAAWDRALLDKAVPANVQEHHNDHRADLLALLRRGKIPLRKVTKVTKYTKLTTPGFHPLG